MYVLQWDDDIVAAKNSTTGGLETYRQDVNRDWAGKINFKEKQDPMNAWTAPWVTGHKYKFHWGNRGVDFESIAVDVSERWKETDKPIMLVHNFTDVRARMDVKVGPKNKGYTLFYNNSIPKNENGVVDLSNTTAGF